MISTTTDSGSVLDLPYVFVGDGSQEEMTMPEDFDFSALANLFQAYMMAQAGGGANGQDPVAMAMQQCCSIL